MDQIPAFLFELRGESPGLSRGLHEGKFRIGSHLENDLVLADKGVAPHQIEIQCQGDKYRIRNLAPEGVVYLNGRAFEEAALQKGDVLALGDSMFRFVPAGEALTQDELWRPVGGKPTLPRPFSVSRNRLWMALAALSIGTVLAVWILTGHDKKDAVPAARGRTADAYDTGRMDPKSLMALYNRGVDLVTAKRWDEAVVVFEKLRGESPGYKECDRLYREAVMESGSLDVLTQGKGLFVEGDLDDAKATLEKVKAESVFRREAEGIVRQVDQGIVDVQLDEAEKLAERKDWVSARELVDRVLADAPTDERAIELRQEMERVQRRPDGAWRPVARIGEASREPPLRSTPSAKTVEAGKSEKDQAAVGKASTAGIGAAPAGAKKKPDWRATSPGMGRARQAYLQGDAEQAMSDLEFVLAKHRTDSEADSARDMLGEIRRAKGFYRQAETLQQAGRNLEALDMWEKFLETDREIAGSGAGTYFRKASVSLGRIFYQKGESAYQANDLVEAARSWKMAARIDPDNADVRKGFDLLSDCARRTYQDGYSLQEINQDQAIEKWKLVMEIVPPSNQYYKKAKQQMDRFSVIP